VRDPDRVSLFVDGAFRIGLPREIVAQRGLTVGQLLTASDLAELESLDEASRAMNAAIRLLSYRPRSRRELEIRLDRKGFSSGAVEAALSDLAEKGYVDDEEFAQYWVENRAENRPRGRRLLASELRSKGVSGDIVDRAIEEADIDEYEDALKLAQRRSAQLGDLDQVVWRRRMIGFLQRRGFAWETVRAVMEQVEHERGTMDDS
jgi:regulatory protein